MNVCRQFLVTGVVQGVWFRDSTRREAQRLGLFGHAVNLTDGRVEVIACGDAEAVEELEEWLWGGPELARVENVDVLECPEVECSRFSIGNAQIPTQF